MNRIKTKPNKVNFIFQIKAIETISDSGAGLDTHMDNVRKWIVSETFHSSTSHKAHKCRGGVIIVDKSYPEIT